MPNVRHGLGAPLGRCAMTELLFGMITDYSVYVIFASAFLSCLALPIPTSLLMLTGGAFVASGDLDLPTVILSALAGAILGDQAGYFIGRTGGAALVERMSQSPSRAAVLKRAGELVDRKGGVGVFFSTWAVAPLGPWVNFIAGATGLGWLRFTIADILGEMIWVTAYVGLGYIFMDHITTVAQVMTDIVGFIVALVMAAAAALWIRAVLRAKSKTTKPRNKSRKMKAARG